MSSGWRGSTPLWVGVSALVLVALVLLFRQPCPAVGGASPSADDGLATASSPGTAAATASRPTRVRASPIAGSWYSGSRKRLHGELWDFLAAAEPWHGPRPLALLCPHAGYRYSGATAAHAFRTVQEERYDRVFVIGPAHRVALTGLGIGSWTHYETPLGRVPVDTEAVERLTRDPLIAVVDGVDDEEHSLEMEVPFLQVVAMGSQIVPIAVGDLDTAGIEQVAGALRAEVGPGDLVVVSSDFTHFGPRFGYEPDLGDDVPAGLRELDMGAFEAFASLDVQSLLAYRDDTGVTVCGFRPMAILQAMLPEDADIALQHYDTSGSMTGDWDNSVSYVSAVATGTPWGGHGADRTTFRLDRAEQLTLLTLARDAIRAHLDDEPPPDLAGYAVTDAMGDPSGAFVTLTLHGRLRGCIGEIPPRRPLVEVVREHAVDAAVNDPRFSPLTRAEFDDVQIDISALTAPVEVASHEEIVLGRDGVYLIKGLRRAVYLPQVAVEQGWTLEETLGSLARKAGLPADGWKDGASFEVFQAQVFHE
jgi:MEMO1 family protein